MSLSVRHPVLRVRIKTEGALAMLGHDRVFDQPVTVTVESAGGLDGAKVRAEGDLRRTALLGNASASDREEILRRKDRDVFETHKYPTFVFSGAYKAADQVLEGTLNLHGVERPVRVPLSPAERDFGWAVEGESALDLRPFGIKPFKALLGALRVSPDVVVNVSAEVLRG